MSDKKEILVIAPHADDEVLGVGGYLLHSLEKGANITILIATIGGQDQRQDHNTRIKEALKVCSHLNAELSVLFHGKDAELDTIPCRDLTNAIDQAIKIKKPDEVFCCYPSYHQDHKKLYECFVASMRLKEGFMPGFVALYEYPFVTSHTEYINGGRCYHDISDVIEKKVELFYNYTTQVKKSPSPLNSEGITTLAKVRGLESGFKYAEMFYIQKSVI